MKTFYQVIVLKKGIGGEFLSEENKNRVMPSTCVYHDNEKYAIELELPGVKKEDIEFVISPSSFCVKAPRNNILYKLLDSVS